jgi:hypothetical protein
MDLCLINPRWPPPPPVPVLFSYIYWMVLVSGTSVPLPPPPPTAALQNMFSSPCDLFAIDWGRVRGGGGWNHFRTMLNGLTLSICMVNFTHSLHTTPHASVVSGKWLSNLLFVTGPCVRDPCLNLQCPENQMCLPSFDLASARCVCKGPCPEPAGTCTLLFW